jgi:hypothetical protein
MTVVRNEPEDGILLSGQSDIIGKTRPAFLHAVATGNDSIDNLIE